MSYCLAIYNQKWRQTFYNQHILYPVYFHTIQIGQIRVIGITLSQHLLSEADPLGLSIIGQSNALLRADAAIGALQKALLGPLGSLCPQLRKPEQTTSRNFPLRVLHLQLLHAFP